MQEKVLLQKRKKRKEETSGPSSISDLKQERSWSDQSEAGGVWGGGSGRAIPKGNGNYTNMTNVI